MMFNKIYKITLALFLLQFLAAPLLFAQDCDRVARKLVRLDRTIERVRDLARSFDAKNEKAEALMRDALEKRDRANGLLNERRCVLANAAVEAAFADLEAAADLLLTAPVARLRSQVSECLTQTEDIVSRSNNTQAIRLLDNAKSSRDTGERNLVLGKAEKAIEFFRVALELCERAADLAQQSLSPQRIDEEKRRFETLRERARKIIESSQNSTAHRIFDQAISLYTKANDAVSARDLENAKRLYSQSVQLLLRVIDMASVTDSPRIVNQSNVALFRLRGMLDDTRDYLDEQPSPRANLLYQRANRFASEAETALEAGKTEEALTKIELAENLLNRVRRVAERRSDSGIEARLQSEIDNTQSDLDNLRSKVGGDAPRDATVLLRMARFALDKAEQAAEADLSRVALEALLASQRFMNRAERILSREEQEQVTQNQIQIRLNQLDAAISDAESRVRDAGQEWNVRLLESAREIRQLAYESLQKGDLQAANEGVQVSFELVRKSTKNVSRN